MERLGLHNFQQLAQQKCVCVCGKFVLSNLLGRAPSKGFGALNCPL